MGILQPRWAKYTPKVDVVCYETLRKERKSEGRLWCNILAHWLPLSNHRSQHSAFVAQKSGTSTVLSRLGTYAYLVQVSLLSHGALGIHEA